MYAGVLTAAVVLLKTNPPGEILADKRSKRATSKPEYLTIVWIISKEP